MPFEKGKSGNPGGRPKKAAEVKALAQSFCLRAIKELRKLMKSPDEKTRLAAAIAMLDRGIGKPAQTTVLVGDEEGGPVQVKTIEIKAVDP